MRGVRNARLRNIDLQNVDTLLLKKIKSNDKMLKNDVFDISHKKRQKVSAGTRSVLAAVCKPLLIHYFSTVGHCTSLQCR